MEIKIKEQKLGPVGPLSKPSPSPISAARPHMRAWDSLFSAATSDALREINWVPLWRREMDRRKFKWDFYIFHQYQHKTEAGQLY